MSLSDPTFRTVFESAPLGIVIVDEALRIVDANAAYCELLGRAKGELVGHTVSEFTHPEDRQRDVEFVSLLVAGRLPRYHAEKRYVKASGQVVWASITATPFEDESGRRLCFGMAQEARRMPRLPGLLPLCPSCHRVHDDRAGWQAVEVFLRERAAVHVSRGLCPECASAAPR